MVAERDEPRFALCIRADFHLPFLMTTNLLKSAWRAAALAAAMIASAHGENIALTNPSFETDFGGTNGTPVSGWFTFGSAQAAIDVSGGFWGAMLNRDGDKAAYAAQISENDGGSMYQTVTLDAGVTYLLKAAIGTSTSVRKNDGKYQFVFYSLDFATALATKDGVVANQTGAFADDFLIYKPTVTGNYNIGLRNRGFVPGTGANNGESTIFFDNVRLTAPDVLYPPNVSIASNDANAVQPVNVPVSNVSLSFNLAITGIEVVGTDAGMFSVITPASPGSPFQIAAGTNGTIQLSLNPGGLGGMIDAQLRITTNEPGSPRLIPIAGFVRDPWIETVASVTVPTLYTNTPEVFQVVVHNNGKSDLQVFGAFKAGQDETNFSVLTDFTEPLIIAPDASKPVTFSFDPKGVVRVFHTTLQIESTDPIESSHNIAVTARLSNPIPPTGSIRLEGNVLYSAALGTGLVPIPGAPYLQEVIDNTAVGPSSARNFYYDSDGDLAFTSTGDTSGNTNPTLALNVLVSGNKTLNFYVDVSGSNTIPDNFAGNYYRLKGLTITRSDNSEVMLDVTQGIPQTFGDPSGKTWTVALNGVGPVADVVGNIDSIPNGVAPDYHFTLTFTESSGNDFSSWASGYGIPNDINDDSDTDGIPALVEYALGFNPTASSVLPGPQPSGNGFTVTWQKGAQAALDPKIDYLVEVSPDLTTWTPAAAANVVETGSSVVLTLPAAEGKSFVRLAVQRQL